METEKKATYEEMMAEAVVRMKMLGLPQAYIDAYKSLEEIRSNDFVSGESEPLSEEEFDVLCHYDERRHWTAWALIKNDNSDEYDCWAGIQSYWYDYYFLLVSSDPSCWEKEREELASMEPTLFHLEWQKMWAVDDYEPITMKEEFVKKKIHVNEKGTIAFD